MSLLRSINSSISSALRDQGRAQTTRTTQQIVSAQVTQGTVSSIDADGVQQIALADGSAVTSYSGARTVTAGDVVDSVGSMTF